MFCGNTGGRGRHTTTQRQLLKHPQGGLLIDSPGIREIQLWASSSALGDSFEEIDKLARSCRFRDCSHTKEPGCAVIGAVEAGRLSQERLVGYRKLSREVQYLELKQDEAAQREQKRRWKAIHKAFRKDKRW
jgi:ribosome biogenesis GTPase / thiamine phosphate phosphatase